MSNGMEWNCKFTSNNKKKLKQTVENKSNYVSYIFDVSRQSNS